MKIAVLGIRGLPANYSGFETCADHTAHHWVKRGHDVLVYCRTNRFPSKTPDLNGIRLKYVTQVESKSFETLSHTFLSILNLLFTEPAYKIVHLYNTGNALFIPFLRICGDRKSVV